MKYIIYFFAILLVWSCDTKELEEIRALPENELEAPVLQSLETIVIDQDSYDEEELVTFSWEPAYFGFNAAANIQFMCQAILFQIMLWPQISNPHPLRLIIRRCMANLSTKMVWLFL
jgi:hypothetical protein